MTEQTRSTRRAFLKGGALAAPLAVAGAASAAGTEDPARSRLAELEDRDALRELHRGFIRHVNDGARQAAASLFADPDKAGLDETVRRLETDAMAASEEIALAADGRSATVRIACAVNRETPVTADSPPAETVLDMARRQGAGVLRHSEPSVLETACVKRDGVWKIASAEYRPA